MKRWQILILFFSILPSTVCAKKIVNVYVWGGEIPPSVIQKFENETGITVNFSTYDNNENMHTKLKASQKNVYDVVLPSAYYVERMQKQGLLTKIDPTKLVNLANLDPIFLENDYDKGNKYSVPFLWGTTGIFYNDSQITVPPESWSNLWDTKWHRQLLLLDDSRELFSIALMTLGFLPNDSDPSHIKEAYQKLLTLIPNIKLFASDSMQAVIIDEDAIIGSAWNGDAFKAHAENQHIQFVYPKEGFLIWVDCLAIPENPPHLEEAYQFINFLLKPEIAAEVATIEGHAITNAKGKALLPTEIRDNPIVYPSKEILQHGYFQRGVGDDTVALFNQYWEQLKLAF